MRVTITLVLFSLLLLSCSNQDAESKQVPAPQANESSASTDTIKNKSKVKYTQGVDYFLLPKPYETGNKEQVVIYEFFGYICPHCYYFEPFMNKWLETKASYTKLIRVPLNFQPSWTNLQQAYLTAEVMGIVEQSHNNLFEAIHKEHKKFTSINDLANWYHHEVGVSKEEFLSTADSFILDSKLRKADKMGLAMQATSTPSVVVNGKYKISTKIKNRDEVINVLKYLVEMEAIEMGIN